MQKNPNRRSSLSRWHLFTVLLVISAVAVMAKNQVKIHAHEQPESESTARVRACQGNLKQMATGLEMYATDNSGRYPAELSALLPNYLPNLPRCPSNELDTYTKSYQTGPDARGNSANYQDYYFLCCSGQQHSDAELAADSPWFDYRLGVQPTLPFQGSDPEALGACQLNLKNIATALEMYSTDYGGRYPSTFTKLMPNYLAAMPKCPVAETDTYSSSLEQGPSSPHNLGDYQNFYHFSCAGGHHKTGSDPAYNSIEGLSP